MEAEQILNKLIESVNNESFDLPFVTKEQALNVARQELFNSLNEYAQVGDYSPMVLKRMREFFGVSKDGNQTNTV